MFDIMKKILNEDKTKEDLQVLEAPVLPLRGSVLFPGISLPMILTSVEAIDAVNAAMESANKVIIVAAVKDDKQEKMEIEEADLYNIGTSAIISHVTKIENALSVSLNGMSRVKINTYKKRNTYFEGKGTTLSLPNDSSPEIEALHRETIKIFSEMRRNISSEVGMPISELIKNVQIPIFQTYLMAVILGLGIQKEQVLLQADSRNEACKIMHNYISYENNVQQLREKISSQVSGELGKEQREYVLRRQLNEIQKELGEETGKESLQTIKEQLENAGLPEKGYAEAEKQLNRLNSLNQMSPEYQVIHSYLKYILELPWVSKTADNLDLNQAEKILNEDHFDLKKIKERIVEQLAVLKLNPSAKAP